MRWDAIREVNLPEHVVGALFLTSMLGRQRPLQQDIEKAKALGVTAVISLSPRDEVEEKSPQYAQALREGGLPWPVEFLPIDNGGVPTNLQAYREAVQGLAERIRRGQRLLLHCAGGLGRTGLVAISILMALGVPLEEATDRVRKAGSSPETPEQWQFLRLLGQGYLSS